MTGLAAWKTLDNVYGGVYITGMETTQTTRDANQAKLDRLMEEAKWRIPVGTVINNRRGTARWNGTAWVYGQR